MGLLAGFLDFDNAFYSVVPSFLPQKLAGYGVTENVLIYVKFSTSRRRVFRDFPGRTIDFHTEGIHREEF